MVTSKIVSSSMHSLLIISSVVLLCLPHHVAAKESSGYIGIGGFGTVVVDRNVSDFDDGSIVSGRVDDRDSGWKLFGGYRFNKLFAMELGRADLNNDLDSETTFTGQSDGTGSKYAAGKVSVDIDDPIAYYLAATGRLAMPLGPAPYDERLALIGKVGVTSWEAKEIIIDSNGRVIDEQDGTDFFAGLGIEYKWPNGISIRAESEFF